MPIHKTYTIELAIAIRLASLYTLVEVMFMQLDSIVRALVEHSGMSARAVSLTLGKADTWARNTMANSRDPRLSTVANVADLAGVDVVLRDRKTGEELGTVEPPRREG